MIHRYELNGYRIVLDVCSGSVHAVDEVAYEMIGLYENHSPEETVALALERFPGLTEEEVCALAAH